MDELDFLLEELSRTSCQGADAVPQASVGVSGTGEPAGKPGQITPVYTTKLPTSPSEDPSGIHAYSSQHTCTKYSVSLIGWEQGESKNVDCPVFSRGLGWETLVLSIHSLYASQILDPGETTLLSPRSATRELDSIMQQLLGLEQGLCDSPTASVPSPLIPKPGQEGEKRERKGLEEGQAKGGKGGASGACDGASETAAKLSKAGASIDDLLGSLASDMEKMGVKTSAKGHCASCGKCIVGKFITALGQVWHPEHFVCLVCGAGLGSTGFFEREGKAYCEKDYQALFSPRCGYCKAPILQNILTAMNQSWHPEHFFCAECGEVFGSEGYMERDGKPYCCKDFYRLFAPKCSGCGEPVQENYLSAANGTWHPQCFVCADCLTPFADGCFLELDGRPLCMLHYHSRQGTLCGGCGAPISGRCITALDRKFHPEHFVCAFCLRQLAQGVFKEHGGKPYCATCHSKLFL